MELDVVAQLVSDFQARTYRDRQTAKKAIAELDGKLSGCSDWIEGKEAEYQQARRDGAPEVVLSQLRELIDAGTARRSRSRTERALWDQSMRALDQDYVLGQVAQGMLSRLVELDEGSINVEVD